MRPKPNRARRQNQSRSQPQTQGQTNESRAWRRSSVGQERRAISPFVTKNAVTKLREPARRVTICAAVREKVGNLLLGKRAFFAVGELEEIKLHASSK